MEQPFDFKGIHFVWNCDKAGRNPLKHDGVTFEQACEVFFDPFLKLVDAERNEEARDAVIAMDQRWNLLYVVHIALEDEKIRIISARKATRQERQHYED